MAVKWYLHDALTPVTGTLPAGSSQSATTPSTTATGASVNRSMDAMLGSAQVGITTIMLITDTATWHRRFVSPPLGAQTIPAGTWTLSAAAAESTLTVNSLFMGFVLYSWRPGSGTKITTLVDAPSGVSNPTVPEVAISENKSCSAATVLAGDVLILEVWNTYATPVAGTVSFYYDGTVEGSSTTNAANLSTTLNIYTQAQLASANPAPVFSGHGAV